MKIYVANTTPQNRVVNYRMPESTRLHTQTIPMGGQIQLSDDRLSEKQWESVCEQLTTYGLLSTKSLREEDVVGQITMIYSRDVPVARDVIVQVMNYNRGVLTKIGRSFREAAAIAVNSQIENTMAEAGAELVDLKMSIEEVSAGSAPRDDDTFNEGLRVVRGGADRPVPAKPKRGNRKAA